MSAGSFGVSGFKLLDRQLAKLGTGFGSNSMRNALHDAAELVAAEAKRLVPVRSGNLRDSIIVSFKPANFAQIEGRGLGLTIYVGPEQGKGTPHNGFYGHMVEFGTIHSAAHPFMRPAVANTRPQAEGIVRAAARDHVRMMLR